MSRSFDTINHPLLLRSLMESGFPSGFVKWTSSYLSSHLACLKVNDTLSSPFLLNLGAPQGSVLGPALFCALLGDLSAPSLDVSIIKYVDDVHFLVPLPSKSNDEVYSSVNRMVLHMKHWTQEHGLILNLDKSKMMLLAHKNSHSNSIQCSFPLPLVNEMKILGVTLNQNLSWNSHTKFITAEANRRFFILRRLKSQLNEEELHIVYYALIRSIVEYANPVFVGMHKCFEGVFQKLDNRAHRLIYGKHYSDRVQKRKCNCPKRNNLLLRRQEQSLKLFTTILQSPSRILHSRLPSKSTRTRTSRLILPYSRTALRRGSFVPYCAQLWNSLP